MRRTLPLAAALPLLALMACAATPAPPPRPAAVAPPPVASEPPPAPAPPPDLSPVDAPADILVLARVARPGELLRAGATWAKLRIPDAGDVVRRITADLGPKLVDLGQAIDVAGTADGWAVSIGVTSLEDARASLPPRSKLVPASNGALRVDALFELDDYGSPTAHMHACEVAPAAGPASTRLVCASSQALLDRLAPYLTRTLPRTPPPSDVHLELRLDPQQVTDARRDLPLLLQQTIGEKSSSASWQALTGALVDEGAAFEADAGKLTLDGKLDDAGLQVGIKATFTGASAQTTRILTDHPERADVAPAAFWRLPADADVAFFHRGVDTARIEHGRDAALRFMAEGLHGASMSDADAAAVTTALAHLLTTPSPAVFARGVDLDATRRALDDAETASGPARRTAIRHAEDMTLGWWMEGLEEPPARVQGAIEALLHTWGTPTFAAWLATEGSLAPSLRLVPIPAKLALPRGSKHLMLSGGTAIAFHLFVVPDGTRTWLALGMDADLLAARLADVVSGVPARTLAGRASLAAMKSLRASVGGFVTLRGLWTASPSLLSHSGVAVSARYAEVARLKELGLAPLVSGWSAVAPAGGAAAGSLEGTMLLTRDDVEAYARATGPDAVHPAHTSPDAIGVAQCDEYLEMWDKCFQDPATRAAARPGMEATRRAWKRAVENPKVRPSLARTCEMMIENFPRAACK